MRQIITGLNLLFLVGCSQVYYEPTVVDEEKINHDNLTEIALIDDDILDYAQDLYSSEPEEVSNSKVLIGSELELVDDFNHDSTLWNYIDTIFISTYCESRGGSVLNWIIDKEYEHLRSGQVRKEIYTCEVDGEVDAALLYDIKFKGPHVKIVKTYMTNYEFEQFRNNYVQLETDDGKISIDKSSLYDANNGSKCRTCSHAFFVDLSNNKKNGQLDKEDKISIIIGDQEYDVFVKNMHFVNDNNKKSFKKGIEHKDELAVKIKGIKEFKTEHILDSVIVISGQEYGNFKEVDPYQRDKHALRFTPDHLAFD